MTSGRRERRGYAIGTAVAVVGFCCALHASGASARLSTDIYENPSGIGPGPPPLEYLVYAGPLDDRIVVESRGAHSVVMTSKFGFYDRTDYCARLSRRTIRCRTKDWLRL